MKDVYQALITQLDTIAELKHADFDVGQIELYDESSGYDFPAAFISIDDVNWKTLAGRYAQEGDSIVVIRLAWVTMTETFKGSSNRQAWLDKLDLLQTVYKKFQGFSGTHFNNLTRIRTSRIKDVPASVVCYALVFATNITDEDALLYTVTHPLQEISMPKGTIEI